MQSVLPLEVKTLKHNTADQVPADRRFAFYLRFFASTAMSRLRNVRTTIMISYGVIAYPSLLLYTEAGGNHRQHSSAYVVIIAWPQLERKDELTTGGDGGIIKRLAQGRLISALCFPA